MAKLVLILAKTGTGKSSSLRNFKRGEASAILASGKELPFKTDIQTLVPSSYTEVINGIQSAPTPVVVIDDTNYLMSFSEMEKALETGYQKFTTMAQDMYKVFRSIIRKPTDQIFYVMAHAANTEDGSIRFKTTGKMLDEKIVLEGLTNILLTADVTDDGQFVFRVKTNGTGIKSPLGMFDTETVPNDLKEVDKAIRKYYGMPDPYQQPIIPAKGKTTKKEGN